MKIAIISDIHEDYISLMKAAEEIAKRGAEAVICLGDIVGYSVPFYNYLETRDASACVAWVMEHCMKVVAGNHDLFAVRRLPQSNVRGFNHPPDWYSLPFQQRTSMAAERLWLYEDHELSALLDETAAAFLISLPEQCVVELDHQRCLLTHFIAPDLTGSAKEFLMDIGDLSEHQELIRSEMCTIAFSGHMHANGMVVANSQHHLGYVGFGKPLHLKGVTWIGAPAITRARNNHGFLMWDTLKQTVEAVSLKRKFSLRKLNP